jgi:hypothetical protein
MFSAGLLPAAEPRFDWAHLLSPLTNECNVRAVTADSLGNSLMAYSDYPEGSDYIWNFSSNVVCKLDAGGQVLWRNAQLPHIKGLATDGAGSVYVVGGRISPPVAPLPSNYFERAGIITEGSGTAYVAKVSPVGQFEWVRAFGEGTSIIGTSITVDASGNYYVMGQYRGTATIGVPLPPTASSGKNIFLAKFSPSGVAEWVRVGRPSALPMNLVFTPHAVHLEASGNLVVCAQSYAPYFDTAPVAGEGAFVARFAPNGNLLSLVPLPDTFAAMAVSPDGSILRAGFNQNTEGFILQVVRLGADGNSLWSREERAIIERGEVTDLAIDPSGNCFVVGTFNRTGEYGPGELTVGDQTLSTTAERETFVAKYSPEGTVRWVAQTKGLDPAYPASAPYRISYAARTRIGLDPAGGVVMAGSMMATVRFGDFVLDGPTYEFWSRYPLFAAKLVDPDATSGPVLDIQNRGNSVLLSWPVTGDQFVLESADTPTGPDWILLTETPAVENNRHWVTLPIGSTTRFFRLRQP